MMWVYGVSASRSTRVLWTLEELAYSYNYVPVDLARGRAGERPLRELNPAEKVPVLQDGDFVLTESAAICLYLAGRDTQRQLLPAQDPQAQARLYQWCGFAISELEQPLWTEAKHRFALPKALRVPAVRGTAKFEFERALKVLESGLGDLPYILGDRFTVADILISHTLAWAGSRNWPLGSTALEAYLTRTQQRPALARALSKEIATAA